MEKTRSKTPASTRTAYSFTQDEVKRILLASTGDKLPCETKDMYIHFPDTHAPYVSNELVRISTGDIKD